MAISWISALKVIPWGDVIEAAPGLVKGARKVFSRGEAPPAEPVAGTRIESPEARIDRLEAAVERLTQQQQASAALVESLAGHHAQVVAAVEVLRLRSRLLAGACAVLLAGLVAVAAWILR